MKIQGSHSIAATPDVVWPLILDPNVITKIMPGAEELVQIEENKFKGVLKLRVGPVQGKFDGVITMSDIMPSEGYHIAVDGRGAAGYVKGAGELKLEASGDETIIHYDGEAQVGGRIASVGQRLLDTSARAIIRQSLEGLEKQVEASQAPLTAAESPGEGAADAVAPSQSEFMLGVARNFVEELVPEERRDEIIGRALLILGGMLLFRLLSEWWLNRLARKIAQHLQDERR